MGTKLELYYAISDSYDPYLNLAIENTLLLNLSENSKILFLYHNDPCVVMGRFQNPWVECYLDIMQTRGVKLVRRQSGGGCVYHDSGNLNWSFIDCQREISKVDHKQILTNALNTFGVDTKVTDRTDIMAFHQGNHFKVSGSAFKQKRDRNIHHGTALINSDLSWLTDILAVKNNNIATKATSSNPNPVINLSKINSAISGENLGLSLVQNFEQFYGSKATLIDLTEIKTLPLTIEYRDQITAYPWLYGQTPRFNHVIEEGDWDVNFNIYKGVIETVEIQSSHIHPVGCGLIAEQLKGIPYQMKSIRQSIETSSGDFTHLMKLLERYVVV